MPSRVRTIANWTLGLIALFAFLGSLCRDSTPPSAIGG
jgi:hypothetical protein